MESRGCSQQVLGSTITVTILCMVSKYMFDVIYCQVIQVSLVSKYAHHNSTSHENGKHDHQCRNGSLTSKI